MAVENLGKKARKGVVWSAVETFSAQIVQLMVSIILARLLTPDVFGIIGMLSIFMALSDSIVDSGFGNALMQKKDRSHTDYSTVFYFNLFISLLIYVIMFVAAPYIAGFYDMPLLTDVTRIISLRFIISGLILVQVTKLTIELNFKKLTKIKVAAVLLSGLVGVTFAYNGYGVWALVAQQLSYALFQCIFIWLFSGWSPSLCFSLKSFRKLFRYGSRLLLTGFYGQIFENINNLVIGKFYSPHLLGFYTKAHSLVQFPSSNITVIIYRVSFPVMCEMQDDDERLSNAIHQLIKQTYFIVFPLMLGMMACSAPLIDVLLSSKWAECVPYMQILCIAMSLFPICAYNIDVLLVKGYSGKHLKIDLVKKMFTLIVLTVTATISVKAICMGGIVTGLFSWFFEGYYAAKILDVRISKQIKDMLPSLIISLVMIAIIYPISYIDISSILKLAIQVVLGAIVYTSFSYVYNRDTFINVLKVVNK